MPLGVGAADVLFNFAGTVAVQRGNARGFAANILAPNARIGIDKNVNLTGALRLSASALLRTAAL